MKKGRRFTPRLQAFLALSYRTPFLGYAALGYERIRNSFWVTLRWAFLQANACFETKLPSWLKQVL